MKKNPLLHGGIVVVIILLFVGTSFIPSTAQNLEKTSPSPSRGIWFYVGGDGPGNYSSIQDAIDDAYVGYTIFVYNGTYYENIILKSGITLIGERADNTIIDGRKIEKVLTANDVIQTSIEGFTITNGSAQQPVAWGGGMMNHYSSVIVSNCIFTNNEAVVGGGVYLSLSPTTIINCTFFDNVATTGDGGGIYINGWNVPKVINCAIFDNYAYYDGGGIYNEDCDTEITNCLVYNNSARRDGDGLYTDSEPIVTNCIIWNNTPEEIYGQPNVTYSDVRGGYTGEGNINLEPMFVDKNNSDFHLQPLSPCIDTGNNLALSLPDADFEGDPRILDGNNDGIAIVDMGIDEHIYIFPPVHNIDKDTYYASIQEAIDDADQGDTIEVPSGTYYENIVVDRTLNLIGENKNNTVIDGSESGDVVYVSADQVTIKGFTIQHSGEESQDEDAGIAISSNYNTILESNIKNNFYGINITGDHNSIKDNTVEHCERGIDLYFSKYNVINQNNFINNSQNAYFTEAIRPYPNTIRWNYWDDWTGFGPKIIIGIKCLASTPFCFPWFKIDWHPKQEPHDTS